MSSSLGWKIFALVFAGFVLASLVTPEAGDFDSAFEIFSGLLSIPAAIGLVLYSFGRRPAFLPFWTAIAWVYALESLFAIGMFIVNIAGTPGRFAASPAGVIGALAIVVALQYFSWLALHRYANGRAQPLSLRS